MSKPWTRLLLVALVATLTQTVPGRSDEKAGQHPIGQTVLLPATTRTVILGTWTWDIETNRQGVDKGADVWWEQVTDREQLLVPRNGAGLVLFKTRAFDKITREDLAALKYADKGLANKSLTPGAVLALRTSDGNFAKLRVVKYRELHDFSFPEAVLLDRGVRAFFLGQPNRKNYHLEVEWVLFRK
jgi:hypothetical protein